MKLLTQSEHLSCPGYGSAGKPLIEVIEIEEGHKDEPSIAHNEVIFIIKGRIIYYFQDLPAHERERGCILFFPSGACYSYKALINSTIVIFRLDSPILLCQRFSIEKLNDIIINKDESSHIPISTLNINSKLWSFLDGVMDCISDGLKNHYWYETKINEFLIYLRYYYPKEEVHNFFLLILSGDTAFSEYVRLNWEQYHSINELATSMNLTRKQFTQQFIKAFGKLPYRWMQERRAKKAYSEIISTNKPFKHIAFEAGFTDDTQFTRFCKKELGKTPTELRKQTW